MRYAVGIDLGGTNIAAGVVNERYEIMEKDSIPTGAGRPWQEIAADMAALAQRLMQKTGVSRADCAGIGIGSPGTCDSGAGTVVFANNLHWEHVPLAAAISEAAKLPASLCNDANCAALGEVAAGAAKGCRDVVLMTLGTGVGGGIVIGGKIYEGVHGAGAEIGHITLILDGEPCACGRKGCMEAYASATALARQARAAAKAHPESLLARIDPSARRVYEAMRAGDTAAAAVVAQYERYLGECVVNLVNLFRPEKLLLGGGISGEGAPLAGRMNAFVRAHCYGGTRGFVTPVETAALGNRAGIVGAAALRMPPQAG